MTPPTPSSSTLSAPAAELASCEVLAVLVTDPTTEGLGSLLDAVLAQSVRPDRLLVLDRTADAAAVVSLVEDHPVREAIPTRVHTAPARVTKRRAVSAAVADEVTAGARLLWVLPVGTLPEHDALEEQLASLERSRSVGVVGPKHLDAADPGRLRSAGITATRTGRVLDDPAEGEADQGQVDHRRDVLAVPFAGILVEEQLVRRLRGWAPGLGGVAADLDLGWRAQGVARRVVVAPSARFHSGRGTGRAVTGSPAARRSARRVAIVRSSAWAAPLLAVWVAITTLAAGLGLLVAKRPRAAWAQLRDLGALDPFGLALARWRTRGRREVRRRDLGGLFVPGSVVRTRVADEIHEALRPTRDAPDAVADPEHQGSPAGLLRHPLTLVVLAALAVTVVAGRGLGGGLVRRLGSGVVGGELTGGRASAASLWHAWADGWTGGGLGGPAAGAPHLALLAVPTWVLEHVPGLGSLESPAGAVVGALLVLALPLAAASAYLSAAVVTRTRWVRAVGALAWVSTGTAGAAVAQGRLGALVALVLLPVVAAGLVLVARRDGTTAAACATALAAAALGAFAPLLLVLVVVVALALVVAGRGWARVRALAVAGLPLLLLGPWVISAATVDWRPVLAGPGLTTWGAAEPAAWQLALLHPGGPGSSTWYAGIPLVALGVLGLLRARTARAATWGLAAVALTALAATLVLPGIRIGAVPDGLAGSGGRVTPWVGTAQLALALALVAALVHGLDGLRVDALRVDGLRVDALRGDVPSPPRSRTLLGVHRAAAGISALAVAGSLGVLAWSGLGTGLRTWTDPRPAAAVDQAEGELAGRTLYVGATGGSTAFRIVGRETAGVARELPTVSRADSDLAPTVSGLLDGSGVRSDALAARAIGFVAVDRGLGATAARRLDATDGLTRLSDRGRWQLWRVAATGPETARPVSPPRLQLVGPRGTATVTATGQHGATDTTVTADGASRLVVAESPAWASRAVVTVDGEPAAAVAGTDLPTYAVPSGTHRVVVDVAAHDRWWHRLQGLALLVVVFLAIPFGTRESRRGR